MNTDLSASLRPLAARRRGGFTLAELLVAVGAVAIISVGLAAVFQTVGRTVTTGKRLSNLTQQAAVLETQMREDFERLTRDGFLVIRHQFALRENGTVAIPNTQVRRFAGDPDPRPRRIDELLFFARGEYRSAREELVPGRSAEATEARIYYGHGQRYTPTAPGNPPAALVNYYAPVVSDMSSFQPRLSEPGINEFASEWNLLRHVTLLSRPNDSGSAGWPENRPAPTVYLNDDVARPSDLYNLSRDNRYQIGAQPAAPSIFFALNEFLTWWPVGRNIDINVRRSLFFQPPPSSPTSQPPGTPGDVARFASGLVDVATTDLAEIRSIVNGIRVDPYLVGTQARQFFVFQSFADGGRLETPTLDPRQFNSFFAPQTTPGYDASVGIMQSWMLQALPALSGYTPSSWLLDNQTTNQSIGGTLGRQPGGGFSPRLGQRIRFEDRIPDVRGTMVDRRGRDVQVRRTALQSLGLSRVAARCTEFIVEWSFGQTYPPGSIDSNGVDLAGRTIWFGATTGTPSDPNVLHYNPNNEDPDVRNSQTPLVPPFFPFANNPGVSNAVRNHAVRQWLIHGVRKRPLAPAGADPSSLVSWFGYYDPTFVPGATDDPAVLPWPWPTMLRVTVTLADASDPSLEQTFQFVFDVPSRPKP